MEIFIGDYRDVSIPDGAIVYCDPPYEDTAEYKEGGFNHSEFWAWARETSKDHDVYVSSYKAPDDIKPVLTFPRRDTLSASQKSALIQTECLFRLSSKEADHAIAA